MILDDKVKSSFKNTNLSKNNILDSISLSQRNYKKFDFSKYPFSNNIFLNLLANESINNKNKIGLEIESDLQYQNNNVFVAEGNVVVYLSDGQLQANKLTFDKNNSQLTLEDEIIFFKGHQYFEASFLSFNTENGKGYIKNVYGILDIKNFEEDTGLSFERKNNDEDFNSNNYDLDNIKLNNTANISLENTFESGRKFNLTNFNFDIPAITKWRFKAQEIIIGRDKLSSEKIFFTNDPFNKPQFILESKNFDIEIENEKGKDKVKLISKNTWINLDNKVSFPIGRRAIIDREPLIKWGLGSDYTDKDGLYLSRTYRPIKIFENIDLQLTPYFLIQRTIKGNTKSFTENDSSILSEKVTTKNSFLDIFALEAELMSSINEWDINLNIISNSLDPKRFEEASRINFTINKTIDLNSSNKTGEPEFIEVISEEVDQKDFSTNFFDTQFYSVYRRKVQRGFSGNSEIYFAKGMTLQNRRIWNKNKTIKTFSISYDIGAFEAEKLSEKKLQKSLRNTLNINYGYEFPLWERRTSNSIFDKTNKYFPKIINQGLVWKTDVNSAIFLYSDNSNQKIVSLNTGPEITLGAFKEKFLDYTNLEVIGTFTAKDGKSPFKFDDVNDSLRLHFNLAQQIYGPLVFNYENYLDLDNGEFSKASYGLGIKRRAYEIGAFYNTNSDAFSLEFKVFNFGYSGVNKSF